MKRIILCIGMLWALIGIAYADTSGDSTSAGRHDSSVKQAKAGGITLYGIITDGAANGIYSVATGGETAVPELVKAPNDMMQFTNGVYDGTQYHALTNLVMDGMVLASMIYSFDDQWNIVNMPNLPADPEAVCLTYNPQDKRVYGCFGNGAGGYDYGTLDLATGVKNVLFPLDQKLVALFCDNSGTIQGIGLNGMIYLIMDNTAAIELAPTGLQPKDLPQSAYFDTESNIVYWMANTENGHGLYKLDPFSYQTEQIASFDSELGWTGVFMPAAEKALQPSWLDNVKANFEKASLTGTITFDLPTRSTAGDPLTGTLGWSVQVDSETPTTGEGQPGEAVTVPVTVEQGTHTFTFFATKDGVNGASATLTRYIGQDIIKNPTNFTALKAETGNEVTISWDPITSGVNGGYIDTEAIRFSLVRRPDNVMLAEATTETSFVDKSINSMNLYTYELTASDGLNTSETVSTAPLLAGEDLGMVPPYTHAFGEAGLGFFKPLDANADGNTWKAEDGIVCYIRSVDKAADDWLVSPQLRLEAGKQYRLSLLLQASNTVTGVTERVEIKYGSAPTPEAMTQTLVATTDVTTALRVDEWLKATDDGLYYVGIHIISEANQGALMAADFHIDGGVATGSPLAVDALTARTAERGEAPVTISFTCPTRNFGGDALQAITKVTVNNSTTGREVAVLTDAAPGKALTAIDDAPAAGQNSYTVVCHNIDGAGIAATVGCYTGLDTPAAPTAVRWTQEGEQALITWEAPTQGAHGGYIDPQALSYRVENIETKQVVTTDATALGCSDTPDCPAGGQISLAYLVTATNTAGTSREATTNYSAFGTGYATPFSESFADEAMHTAPWMMTPVDGSNEWMLIDQIETSGASLMPQDDDRGMLVFAPSGAGSTRIELPLVDISAPEHPAVKLWHRTLDLGTTLTVQTSTDYGYTWTNAATLTAEANAGWTFTTIDLSHARGCDHLLVGILGSAIGAGNPAMADNITVGNHAARDLRLTAFDLPVRVEAGSRFTATAQVLNSGRETIDRYRVELYAGDALLQTLEGNGLDGDRMAGFDFEVPVPIHATALTLTARVVCEGDENEADNTLTREASVARSPYPQPTGLTATNDGGQGVQLAWTQPDLQYHPTVSDDLESYEPWSVGGIDVTYDETTQQVVVRQTEGHIGGYKVIDNDRSLTTYSYGMIPGGGGAQHLGDGMACQVFDTKDVFEETALMAAHSGTKMFCFWTLAEEGKANDDYLILPRLADDDKYISFWARSMTAKYGLERFEIMVSSTGNAIGDFMPFMTVEEVPFGSKLDPEAGYTFYEFELPEDTKYAAIHYTAQNTLALLIDDITYTSAESTELTLEGYNIYRNDLRINDAPVTEAAYTDTPAESGTYLYHVTAVFADGESGYSNAAEVQYTSGMDMTNDSRCAVYVDGHDIVVSGLATGETIELYLTDGRLLCRLTAETETRIPVAPGMYLVKAAGAGQIVMVK